MEEDIHQHAFHGKRRTLPEGNKPPRSGFGTVADHCMDRGFDLNDELVRNKQATYFFRMKGDAMRDAGIFDGDILVVDRSVHVTNGKVIVAVLNGELLVRRFHKNFSSALLVADNSRYKSINLAEFSDFLVWGVVVYAIHPV
jgi:DNA polymerase V